MSDFTKFFVNSNTGQIETIAATKIAAVDFRAAGARIGAAKMPGTDTNFFVSGSIAGKASGIFGISAFGGDVFVSGTLYANTGLSGSLTRITDGTSYLIAGSGISVTTGSSGAVTISSTPFGTAIVKEAISTESDGSTTDYTLQNIPDDGNQVQVYINGILRLSGSGNDYTYDSGNNQIDFVSTPPSGSILQVVYTTGSSGLGVSSGWTRTGTDVHLTTVTDKVGIGSATPIANLEVGAGLGSPNTIENISITADANDDAALDLIEEYGGDSSGFGTAYAYGFRFKYDGGDNNLYLQSGEQGTVSTWLTVERTSGHIGIGITNPTSPLEIDAGSSTPPGLYARGKHPIKAAVDESGGQGIFAYRNIAEAGSNPLVYIHDDNTSNTQTSLSVRQDGSGDILNLFDGTTEVFTVINGGNTGIGASSPDEKLTVEGVISLGEQGSAPSATSGYGKVYVKNSDSKLYFKNDSGTEFDLTAAAAGFAPIDASYITIGANGSLTNERTLTAGDGVTITDAGANSPVTLSVNAAVADFDFVGTELRLEATVVKSAPTDSGTATPAVHALTFTGGEGIDTSAAGSTVTITGEDATTGNKGIASFSVADFSIASGHISLDDNIAKTTTSDSGTATASAHNINFVGAGPVTTSATGNTVTITSTAGGGSMSSFDLAADSGTTEAVVDGNTVTMSGGTGIDTVVSSADTVTVAIDDSIVATISGSTFTGAVKFNAGLSGSLTRLIDGSSYLAAGAGIAISSASNGQILITNDGTVGDITGVTAGTGLTGGGTSGTVTLDIDDSIVATISGSTFTGATKHNAGLSGSLTQLTDGSSFLIAGSNVTITSASNGAVTIVSADTDTTYTAGTGLNLSTNVFSINDSIVATISGSTFTGAVNFNAGLSGSLTHLEDGTSYLKEGSNVTITSGSDGSITISAPAAGSGAPADASYLVLGTNATLTDERVFTAGTGLISTDAGAGSTLTLGINDSVVATISGSTFTGAVNFNAGLSGSLTHLTDGSSYLAAGAGIAISSASNGQILITNDGTVGDITGVTAGTGLTGGGSSGDVTLDINDSIVATISGSTFTGVTKHNAGLSGSLTQLTDGSSFLIAGSNVTITSASNGAITVTSADTDTTYTAGTGLNLSTNVFSIDDSIVATVSGSTFTGAVNFNAGLSGSLQRLIDGTTYLAAGAGITIATGSSGQITITNDGTVGDITAVTAGLGLTGGGTSGAVSLAITDSVVATVSGSTFTGTVNFNAGLSGSLTQLTDGSSFLIAGSNVTITSASNGAITISSAAGGGGSGGNDFFISPTAGTLNATGSTAFAGGQLGTAYVPSNIGTDTFFFVSGTIGSKNTAVTGSAVFGGDVVISGTMHGNSTIGTAEDGVYTDGLFTDFTTTTLVGTAIDRFNEVLLGLAPAAAPQLDDMDCDDSGTAAKLSFGSSNAIAGYTDVAPSGLTPASGLSDADVNGTYSSSTVSNDVRVACFAGSTVINGTLNEDVSADSPNYPANAFGNANQGTIKLYVNDNSTPVHTTDMSSFAAGNSLNGNSSGFTSLLVSTPGHFSDGSEFATFQHRTGAYQVGTADQRTGWNFARVVHTIGATDTTCNYAEWVNDPDANALSIAGTAFDTLSMTGTKNLSGVKYNTGGTAKYRARVLNSYRNVYSTSNITYSTTRVSVGSQSFPSINTGAGEDETKLLHLTGSATINADPILNSSITVSTNVPHPLKSNLSSAGSQSITGILLYNLSDTATVLAETFKGESYRLLSGSYNSQSDVTSVGNAWNSTTSLTGVDGMMFYNSALRSPTQGVASGDFRNTADGGSIANGPGSNVNYSALTTGTKTFYRKFQNTTGGSKTDFNLTIAGSGTIMQQGSTYGTSGLAVLCKLSTTSAGESTGWMDLSQVFATGQVGNGDGCLVGTLDTSLNATNQATFGVEFAADDEWIVIKVETNASFTGNASNMTVAWI